MFFEMLAADVLDPMSECPCGRDDHRRTNCPDDFPMAPIGTLPSKPPSVNHLIKKKINGQRITLHHVRPDGKPHYIGLPGVVKDIGHRVPIRCDEILYKPHIVPPVPTSTFWDMSR